MKIIPPFIYSKYDNYTTSYIIQLLVTHIILKSKINIYPEIITSTKDCVLYRGSSATGNEFHYLFECEKNLRYELIHICYTENTSINKMNDRSVSLCNIGVFNNMYYQKLIPFDSRNTAKVGVKH